MPNTREKLIELLEERRLEASEVCGSMNKGFGAWYADHLIANGVTVQQYGQWYIDKSFVPFICTCSECDTIYDVDGAFEWKFCPNCGNGMRGYNFE